MHSYKFKEISRLGQTFKLERPNFSEYLLKTKTGSISEPGFGGHRKLTNGWVSVRCPPNRGSENEAVFGFSFFEIRPSALFFFVDFAVGATSFLRNRSYKNANNTCRLAGAAMQTCECAKDTEGEGLDCV